MTRIVPFCIAALLAIFLFATPAQAICVACTCSGSSNGLDFSAYNPLDTFDLKFNGSVSVTCSVGGIVALVVGYEIKLAAGNSLTYTTRKLTLGANSINYNLYTTNALSTVWGDGTGSTGTVSDTYLVAVGAATTQTYTVYGKIPKQQNVPKGTYSDSFQVSILY